MSDEDQEPLISEQRWFSLLLEHAVQMSSHIMDEVDEEDLENTTVSLNAAFVLDLLDTVIEYACRYEGFHENMEDLMTMYLEQAERGIKFGQRTIH